MNLIYNMLTTMKGRIWMYQYFLGKTSNFLTRKANDPIIVGAEDGVRKRLNQWLDTYQLDFDDFIRALKDYIPLEVVEIGFNDERKNNFFVAYEKEPVMAILTLDSKKIPSIGLYSDSGKGEYVYQFQPSGTFQMIDHYEIDFETDIYFEENVLEKSVAFSKGESQVTIKMDRYDPQIFQYVRKTAHRLENMENLVILLLWLNACEAKIRTFDLYVASGIDKEKETSKVSVIDNKVFQYAIMNSTGLFSVDEDGSWQAKCMDIPFMYSAATKQLFCGSMLSGELMERLYEDGFKRIIGDMFRIRDLIDYTLERAVQENP